MLHSESASMVGSGAKDDEKVIHRVGAWRPLQGAARWRENDEPHWKIVLEVGETLLMDSTVTQAELIAAVEASSAIIALVDYGRIEEMMCETFTHDHRPENTSACHVEAKDVQGTAQERRSTATHKLSLHVRDTQHCTSHFSTLIYDVPDQGGFGKGYQTTDNFTCTPTGNLCSQFLFCFGTYAVKKMFQKYIFSVTLWAPARINSLSTYAAFTYGLPVCFGIRCGSG